MSRNQLGRTEIERIISQQASRQQRLDCADAVILNEGINLADLKQLVHEMMTRFGL
jgi:dephospho-CoA kinase